MPALADIRKKYSYAVKTKCESFGCKLDLKDLDMADIVVLDAEELRNKMGYGQSKICDHIIFKFNGRPQIFVVEQKKTSSASEIPAQLAAGAKIAIDIISEFKTQFKDVSIYYLGVKRHWRTREQKMMKETIKFKGKNCHIARLRCGESLLNFTKRKKRKDVPYEGVISLS